MKIEISNFDVNDGDEVGSDQHYYDDESIFEGPAQLQVFSDHGEILWYVLSFPPEFLGPVTEYYDKPPGSIKNTMVFEPSDFPLAVTTLMQIREAIQVSQSGFSVRETIRFMDKQIRQEELSPEEEQSIRRQNRRKWKRKVSNYMKKFKQRRSE